MLETINKGKKCRCIGCEYDAFCKGVCKAHYEQIREWEGKYYVQVEKNGVHRRRLCDTLELAISVRDAFDKELDEIWS